MKLYTAAEINAKADSWEEIRERLIHSQISDKTAEKRNIPKEKVFILEGDIFYITVETPTHVDGAIRPWINGDGRWFPFTAE